MKLKQKSIQQSGVKWLIIAAFILLLEIPPIIAAERPTPAGETPRDVSQSTIQLSPVIVTAPRVTSEANRVPAAVSTVQGEQIRKGRSTAKLNEALAGVPGVFAQNEDNYAQDLRISIRGFGARSAFGIRGIQIQVDGLPYTLPDGQSTFDSIDPEIISQLEVMRGPVSALYGNASGAVINISIEDGTSPSSAEGFAAIGEDGFSHSLLKGGGQFKRVNSFAALSQVATHGFRDHSEAESNLFYGKLRYDLDVQSDITLILNGVRTPEAKDPGGLTLQQTQSDPEQASPLSLTYDSGEVISDDRVGLVYRREVTGNQHLEAVVYGNRRDLENAIPFRFIDLERRVFGGRAQYDLEGTLLGLQQRLVGGIELQHQADDRINHDNMDGAPGNTLLLDQDETVTATGIYLQEEIEPVPDWAVLLGGRYDNVAFEINDRLLADGNDSGSRTFDQVSARAGLIWVIQPQLRAYANISQSFETPTTTEVVNRPEGGGGINPQIEPQTAVNYEVGLKARIRPSINLEMALFLIQLKDELIAYRDTTDRVFYRNAGESQRRGAELGVTQFFGQGWQWHLAYSYLFAEFETYFKDGVELEGNRVPGLPEHRLFAELLYAHASGFYAAGNVLFAGEFFVDDENTMSNTAYTVFSARLGFRKRFKRWHYEPFLGVRNFLDENYNNNVRINAAGGRYFEPAAGRNWYGGISISHQWL